jgi:Phosphotransferase enzyme family
MESSSPNQRSPKTTPNAGTANGRVLLSPLYAASIWLEQRAARWGTSGLHLRFPRDVAEIAAAPERLFALLQAAGACPSDATFLGVRRRGGLANEPDKDRVAATVDVVMRSAGVTSSLPVFVKFESGRGLPLLLQALRAAVEPGVAREVDFYRNLAATVPLRTPRVYFADAIHAFNRVCIILEHVDGYNLADWHGCPIAAVRAMLAGVARMNAAFVGKIANDPRTRWIPARAGLDYASFVATLGGSAPAWYRDLWTALDHYFRNCPVTLVHGDCRPGNMLFLDHGAIARQLDARNERDAEPWPPEGMPTRDVVFTDWGAVNAAPLLWDFTYCTVIGIRTVDREAHLERLRDEFVATLRAGGVAAEYCDRTRCRIEVDLLTMVLYYVASLVISKGYWDKQGNTLDDWHAWSGRILAALRAVDTDRTSAALGVSPELVRRLQREGALKKRESSRQ